MRPTTSSSGMQPESHGGGVPDPQWMNQAIELAARGRFGASPNPLVGAVILNTSNEVVGEGFHANFGGPHAEIIALTQAGEKAQGGTLFVTLEPCNHHGKTPPCVDAIIAAGVKRVVVATMDPNQIASGGVDRLRTEGIDVVTGISDDSARLANRRWLSWVEHRRPWVTLKAGMSLDGRIATGSGESQWITGSESRHRALELREEHDAILVGVGTVLADDPRLTRRLGLSSSPHLRVVLDSGLRTPVDAEVVRSAPESTLIAHALGADPERYRKLEEAGVNLLGVDVDAEGRTLIAAVLDHLGRNEITSLLVEGGSAVHGGFLDAELFDEVVLFVAPMMIGGDGLSAIGGRGIEQLTSAVRLKFSHVARHGDDLEVVATRLEQKDVHGTD
ncbi:MAG: bifunctional diaminohydroxyphosphoribosylaminopyrimidine deaminase/5-amino-6-(5-phosphoribosylamino)uracil reductase RibD [bacterium]|nr:bifunctional diaminohydroxyphosphoribosylaminopyrimidine deaminase/5-amino-6-(5-phosphoribosylamino)uracil reductase RibD [bacterium]